MLFSGFTSSTHKIIAETTSTIIQKTTMWQLVQYLHHHHMSLLCRLCCVQCIDSSTFSEQCGSPASVRSTRSRCRSTRAILSPASVAMTASVRATRSVVGESGVVRGCADLLHKVNSVTVGSRYADRVFTWSNCSIYTNSLYPWIMDVYDIRLAVATPVKLFF